MASWPALHEDLGLIQSLLARGNGLEHHDPPPELDWGLTLSCYAPSLLWVLQLRDSHHPHISAAEGLEITHLKAKRHWEGPPDSPQSLAKAIALEHTPWCGQR